ncbi:MAG: tyrosine-type recombinase/integrase [Chloroflexi bacterium]|nr:tyrosine-type recombinase/integrase [Chloroflexota bacterium]
MKTPTNAEWIRRFEAYLKRRFPDRSTAKHYSSDLRLFAQHHSGPLQEVTIQDVDHFVDHQYERGLAPATVKRRVAALKTCFDFLAEESEDPERPNPVSMRRHAGRQPRRLPRDLSDAEVRRFLAVVHHVRDRAMVCLMLYAGLRVGEVQGLRRENITIPEEPSAPVRLCVTGKGRKERIVYLCREGYEPLAAYVEPAPIDQPAQPLFRNRFGKPITVAGIQERVQKYARESGVAVTCHRLRHTFARWMAESEMPVLALSRLLGHSSVLTTQPYIDGADPQVRRSYERAMELAREPLAVPSGGAETPPPPLVAATGPALVQRQLPDSFDGRGWMPEAPAWLREGCLDWVHHQWPRWAPSRRQRQAGVRLRELHRFWRWQLQRREFTGWQDLTTADITAFTDAQLGRGLKAKTVKIYLDSLYTVLRYLAREGRLAAVPSRPALTLPHPLPRHLKPQELLALEAHVTEREKEAQEADWLHIALYVLLAYAGLRVSEALDLQVKSLDLAAQRIRVWEGKGRRDRVVFLTQQAAQRLGRYLETVPHAPDDLVLSHEGRPLTYNMAWRRICRLGEAAGVQGLSPHRLRHSYATQLLNNGMSLVSLQRLMGHENLNTTLIYARLADRTIEQQYRTAMGRVADSNQMNSM